MAEKLEVKELDQPPLVTAYPQISKQFGHYFVISAVFRNFAANNKHCRMTNKSVAGVV